MRRSTFTFRWKSEPESQPTVLIKVEDLKLVRLDQICKPQKVVKKMSSIGRANIIKKTLKREMPPVLYHIRIGCLIMQRGKSSAQVLKIFLSTRKLVSPSYQGDSIIFHKGNSLQLKGFVFHTLLKVDQKRELTQDIQTVLVPLTL